MPVNHTYKVQTITSNKTLICPVCLETHTKGETVLMKFDRWGQPDILCDEYCLLDQKDGLYPTQDDIDFKEYTQGFN